MVVSIKDLDFVFSEAGFDREAYRSFPLTLQNRVEQETQTRTSEELVNSVDFAARVHAPLARTASGAASLLGESVAAQHRPPALGELLSQANHGLMASIETFGRALTVTGAAGGVGTTTIAATLARISSHRGCNVFFFDGAEESIAPLYLGAGQIVSGASAGWSFLPHPELRQGSISVVACGHGGSVGGDQSPWSRARSLSGVAADILIDSGPYRYFDSPTEMVSDTTSLIVLAPDIRCVLQVRSIEKRFAAHEANFLPRYVLNQFDPEIPLHREVRVSLANHLGDRLAPITVRSAREIPKALSEGLTVIDYAPNSMVASEIVQVADWLRSSTRSAAHQKRSAAVAGL